VALPIAACLLLAVLAALVAGAVLLLGVPAAPVAGSGLAGGGAVAALGLRGLEALLTAFEQAAAQTSRLLRRRGQIGQ
jgi:hypothetical protein